MRHVRPRLSNEQKVVLVALHSLHLRCQPPAAFVKVDIADKDRRFQSPVCPVDAQAIFSCYCVFVVRCAAKDATLKVSIINCNEHGGKERTLSVFYITLAVAQLSEKRFVPHYRTFPMGEIEFFAKWRSMQVEGPGPSIAVEQFIGAKADMRMLEWSDIGRQYRAGPVRLGNLTFRRLMETYELPSARRQPKALTPPKKIEAPPVSLEFDLSGGESLEKGSLTTLSTISVEEPSFEITCKTKSASLDCSETVAVATGPVVWEHRRFEPESSRTALLNEVDLFDKGITTTQRQRLLRLQPPSPELPEELTEFEAVPFLLPELDSTISTRLSTRRMSQESTTPTHVPRLDLATVKNLDTGKRRRRDPSPTEVGGTSQRSWSSDKAQSAPVLNRSSTTTSNESVSDSGRNSPVETLETLETVEMVERIGSECYSEVNSSDPLTGSALWSRTRRRETPTPTSKTTPTSVASRTRETPTPIPPPNVSQVSSPVSLVFRFTQHVQSFTSRTLVGVQSPLLQPEEPRPVDTAPFRFHRPPRSPPISPPISPPRSPLPLSMPTRSPVATMRLPLSPLAPVHIRDRCGSRQPP